MPTWEDFREDLIAADQIQWSADCLAAGIEPDQIARRYELAGRLHEAIGELEDSLAADAAPAFDALLQGQIPDTRALGRYERAQEALAGLVAEVTRTANGP
jgi:hypothetical protein